VAVEEDLARVGLVHAGQDLHHRGLAGAVLAEQRVRLAGVQVDRPVDDRADGTESLGDVAQGHGRDGIRLAGAGRAAVRRPGRGAGLVSALGAGRGLLRRMFLGTSRGGAGRAGRGRPVVRRDAAGAIASGHRRLLLSWSGWGLAPIGWRPAEHLGRDAGAGAPVLFAGST
jgi:hypothetical protein